MRKYDPIYLDCESYCLSKDTEEIGYNLSLFNEDDLTNKANSSIINMGNFESLYSKDAADSMQKLLESAPQNVQDAWNKYADKLTRLDKTTNEKGNDSMYFHFYNGKLHTA